MNEPSEREQAFLDAARLLPDSQRAAYLDAASAGDAALRQRLETLLQGKCPPAAPQESPPEPPASTILLTIALTEKPGDRIGSYKLLQQIGEGGCGAVYMAEQDYPVRRRVALKVIKLGMDTRSVIARFEAERQALALMDHPNIAKVLDAGATGTGRPFFVMELVRGIKITGYCDQNKLPTRERLALFIQVCHAIQHAHQKGVIHRDIKPSNILVTLHDGVPVPKVIDFGIAKATDQRLTDKTLFTQFEQLIGTPAYMSPEQAEMSGLDIDTRSDIYSLGVLLYELLTGVTPFDAKELVKGGADAMRRTIREREPERPSTRLSTMAESERTATAMCRQADVPRLIGLIRGDLDWIVMKALEKDRTRRYETANGLAMDVQRYLDNEPVIARPPSNLYRFQKLVRRHRATVAAVGAVALALLLGFGSTLYLFVRERAAHRREVALEKEQRQHAELGEKYSRAGLLMSQNEFEQAETLVNDIPASKSAVPLYSVLGLIHGQRGEWQLALSNYAKTLRFMPSDEEARRQFLPTAYHALAPLLVQTGDLAGYRAHCQAILREFGATTDPVTAERMAKDCMMLPPAAADLPTLAKMADTAVAAGPGHKDWAYFQFVKGLAEYRRGNFTNAVEWLTKVVAQPADPKRTVQAYMTLAMARHELGRLEEARATLAQGLELSKEKLYQPVKGNADGVWNDWIIAQTLTREAVGLIGVEPRKGTAQ